VTIRGGGRSGLSLDVFEPDGPLRPARAVLLLVRESVARKCCGG
jgi:hypothetical protein